MEHSEEPFEGQTAKDQLHVRIDKWQKDWFRKYAASCGKTMSQVVLEYVHALYAKERQERESGNVESI
ncbi:MAG: hypothetical protein KDB07_02990 [Planctomycetes bacterium]|nr:hypothetical protein [Planctomycetota bacterium]